MSSPRAFVSVTNDLTTDQRADRTCRTLAALGYDVTLVGRKRADSQPLAPRSYRTFRMRLPFDKGPLFYASYNLLLFIHLLTHHYDLVVSNDLDTLPANYFAERIKSLFRRKRNSESGKATVHHLHDCHEYFRGMPELNGRPRVTAIWKRIEDRIFPRLAHVTAVNKSVADLYHVEYGNAITVVRNVPFRKTGGEPAHRSALQIGPHQRIILYQGAVNIDRGLEEAILAMKHLKADAVLVIAGTGDIFHDLIELADREGVAAKIRFLGQVPFQALHAYTRMADLGLSIEKDVSINYHFCLPNKFLDYIQAGVPVLVSPFPEMQAIVDRYDIGTYLKSNDPVELAGQIDALLADPETLARFRANQAIAAEDLCWEREEKELIRTLGR